MTPDDLIIKAAFHRAISMNGPMEELALIRTELKSIGININQQARYFNASRSATKRGATL